jgi:RNA polymerase sigma factor (sigma-70 family)
MESAATGPAPASVPASCRVRPVAAAMDEKEPGYDDLIRPVEPLMMRSIWRIVRQREAAEDALQDALALVWRKRRVVARHPNPRALILKIAVDAALDALRRSRRRLRHEVQGLPFEAAERSELGIERTLENRLLRAAVLEAIGRLPKRQAAAALLRLVEEQPYPEIARVMGCSEATVRIHVMRARSSLAARLAKLRPGGGWGKEEPDKETAP